MGVSAGCNKFNFRRGSGKQVQQNGIRSSSGRRVQEHFRGDKEKQAPQIRRVLYQGRKVHHVEAVGDRNASYDDFLNDLTKGETPSVGTDCTTSSTNTSAREPLKPVISRSCS